MAREVTSDPAAYTPENRAANWNRMNVEVFYRPVDGHGLVEPRAGRSGAAEILYRAAADIVRGDYLMLCPEEFDEVAGRRIHTLLNTAAGCGRPTVDREAYAQAARDLQAACCSEDPLKALSAHLTATPPTNGA